MNSTGVEAIKLGVERERPAQRRETRSRRQDRLATVVVWSLAALGLSSLGVIIVAILWHGLTTALNPGFIFGEPQAMKAGGGIWPMVVSSFYLAFLTIIIVLPVGVGAAIYMSDSAPTPFQRCPPSCTGYSGCCSSWCISDSATR